MIAHRGADERAPERRAAARRPHPGDRLRRLRPGLGDDRRGPGGLPPEALPGPRPRQDDRGPAHRGRAEDQDLRHEGATGVQAHLRPGRRAPPHGPDQPTPAGCSARSRRQHAGQPREPADLHHHPVRPAARRGVAQELQYARGVRDGRITDRVRMLPILYEFPEAMQTAPDRRGPTPRPGRWCCPTSAARSPIERLIDDFAGPEKGDEEIRRWASQHLNVEIGLACTPSAGAAPTTGSGADRPSSPSRR
jgi:hypothetical protein